MRVCVCLGPKAPLANYQVGEQSSGCVAPCSPRPPSLGATPPHHRPFCLLQGVHTWNRLPAGSSWGSWRMARWPGPPDCHLCPCCAGGPSPAPPPCSPSSVWHPTRPLCPGTDAGPSWKTPNPGGLWGLARAQRLVQAPGAGSQVPWRQQRGNEACPSSEAGQGRRPCGDPCQ